MTGSENTEKPAENGPRLRVLRQYIKDLSFEAPGILLDLPPNIELAIDVKANATSQEQTFEVILKKRAKAMNEGHTLFILELEYAGLFQLIGFGEADLQHVLLVECPRILFPFSRQIIAQTTSSGGFAPLLVDPVDFSGLQKQHPQGLETAKA